MEQARGSIMTSTVSDEGKLLARFEKHDHFVELQNKFLDNDLAEQGISNQEDDDDNVLRKLSMIVSVRQFIGSLSLTVT